MKKFTTLAACAVMVPAFTFGVATLSAAEPGAASDTQRSSMPDRQPGAGADTERSNLPGRDPGASTDTQRSSMPGKGHGTVGEAFKSSKASNWLHSSDLVGTKVRNSAGDKDIGSISDLIIDENGQIVAVVVGIGGFLGMGQKDVALPWQRLERTLNQSGDGFDIRANVSDSELKDAVEYKND